MWYMVPIVLVTMRLQCRVDGRLQVRPGLGRLREDYLLGFFGIVDYFNIMYKKTIVIIKQE
jgi:hypothetical protein